MWYRNVLNNFGNKGIFLVFNLILTLYSVCQALIRWAMWITPAMAWEGAIEEHMLHLQLAPDLEVIVQTMVRCFHGQECLVCEHSAGEGPLSSLSLFRAVFP